MQQAMNVLTFSLTFCDHDHSENVSNFNLFRTRNPYSDCELRVKR